MISKQEEEEARLHGERIASRAKPANVALTVSIPVTLGGYTGQRDQWEELERDYKVRVDGDIVILTEVSGNVGRQIKFARSGIEAAIKILQGYKA